MPKISHKLLSQEVTELTELLHSDPHWADLRRAMLAKGLCPDRLLLGGFMEDDDGNEYGVVIADDLVIYEYQRKTNSSNEGFEKWQEVIDAASLLDSFPAIECALQMARSGKHLKKKT